MKTPSLLIAISLFSVCLLNSSTVLADERYYSPDNEDVISTSVYEMEPKSAPFETQICSEDKDGNILGCANISTNSVKNETDWDMTLANGAAWGTHTSKINTSEIVEEHYPKN